jgi:hypothetical protein
VKIAVVPLLKDALRKYVPGVKLLSGVAEGNAAPISVLVALCTVNVVVPSFTSGLVPKFAPAMVTVPCA